MLQNPSLSFSYLDVYMFWMAIKCFWIEIEWFSLSVATLTKPLSQCCLILPKSLSNLELYFKNTFKYKYKYKYTNSVFFKYKYKYKYLCIWIQIQIRIRIWTQPWPSDTYARYETMAIHHWFRWWLVAWSAPSHYLYQCWKLSIVLSGRNIGQI